MKILDPVTMTFKEISDEEWEEEKRKGKENAYLMFKNEVEKMGKHHGLSLKDAVNALTLFIRPCPYELDVRRLFEWNNLHEFFERLVQEGTCSRKL